MRDFIIKILIIVLKILCIPALILFFTSVIAAMIIGCIIYAPVALVIYIKERFENTEY